MSALTIYAGLEERFKTIAGLKVIILGQPTTIQDAPALYTALSDAEWPLQNLGPAHNINGTIYRFGHRLVIRWQSNPDAEQELLSLLDAIPASVQADPRLGGRITSGFAAIQRGAAGFVDIAGTRYRIVDYTSDITQKTEG